MKEVMKEVITKLKEADAVLIGASNGLSICGESDFYGTVF